MRSPSERRGREGLKTKPRDYEDFKICERLFAPSPASEKQIENLPFLATERQGEALPLVFLH